MNNPNFWGFLKTLIIPAGAPYSLGEKRRLDFFMVRAFTCTLTECIGIRLYYRDTMVFHRL